ncbi:hypothetical protein FE275_24945 [Pseudomonas koreensis]|nr:hypothetical protein FE275_24945 [Pseudomonas koreensis]
MRHGVLDEETQLCKQPKTKCGSGLARECGVTVNINAECYTAFASKPAPTEGSPVFRKTAIYRSP